MLNTNPAEWSMHEKDTENCTNTKKEISEGTENTIFMLAKKRNQDIQENEQKKTIEMLTTFQIPRSSKYSSTVGVSSCSFSVKKIAWENGVCTYYCTCRFQGQDYMHQVNGASVFMGNNYMYQVCFSAGFAYFSGKTTCIWVIVITKGLTDFKGKTICVSYAFMLPHSAQRKDPS